MIAVVRVRGDINAEYDVKRTFELLKLQRKNYCIIVPESKMGMVQKVKDYVTYGIVTEEFQKQLFEKKGEEAKDGIKVGSKTYKHALRLNPPRKGYGRKGIKLPFNIGGALGNRKDKITDLIERML